MDIPSFQQNFDPNGGLVAFGSDEKLFVQFYRRSVVNPIKSKTEGRPVHEGADYVRIQQPGERDVIDRPVGLDDPQRFPRQWMLYKANQEQTPDGSPLSLLFPVNPEIVENLRYFKIATVEQLATLNDTQKQNVGMGANAWCDMARKFLDTAAKGAPLHEMQKELQRRDEKIAELMAKVEQLSQALADDGEDEPAAPRRRGRPPKTEAAYAGQ